MQKKVEIITKYTLQFWTEIPKNGHCGLKEIAAPTIISTFKNWISKKRETSSCWFE